MCHSISFIHTLSCQRRAGATTFKAAWWCIWHMKLFVGCCAPIKIAFAAIIIGCGWGVLVDNWLGWLGWLGAPPCRRSLGGRHDGIFHVVATRTYKKCSSLFKVCWLPQLELHPNICGDRFVLLRGGKGSHILWCTLGDQDMSLVKFKRRKKKLLKGSGSNCGMKYLTWIVE